VIEAADRLQDADAGREGGARVAEVVDKGSRAPQGEKVIADAGPGEDGGGRCDEYGYKWGVQGFEVLAASAIAPMARVVGVRSLWSLTLGVVGYLTLSHLFET
jgi:hypothetical protein